jgi:uncharacterized protein YqgC (DUF456 family)
MIARRIFTGSIAALILVSVYVFIFYSHRYNSHYEMGSLVGICGGFIVLIAVRVNGQTQERRNSIIVTSIGLIVGSVLGAYVLRWAYKKYELATHGLVAKGMVVGFNRKTIKGTLSYHAIVDYEFNNRAYTQQFRDDDYVFLTSDSVTMLCSSTDPELCTITAYQRNGAQIKW